MIRRGELYVPGAVAATGCCAWYAARVASEAMEGKKRTPRAGSRRCQEEAGKLIDNPYYSRELHGTYELFDLGDFVLEEEGYTLRDCKRTGRSGSSAPPRTTRSS
jgi:hypothetical protein